MTDLAATLEWLVNIPSVTGSEGRIATAISERLLPIWTRFTHSLASNE